MHGNVKDSEESLWTKHVSESVGEIAKSEGIISQTLGYEIHRHKPFPV